MKYRVKKTLTEMVLIVKALKPLQEEALIHL